MTKKHEISFIDLKYGLSWEHNPPSPHKLMPHEFWTDYLFSVDGVPSHLRVSSRRQPLQWQLQGQKFFMLGSVSIYGFCTTYLSRKPERYPSMLACSSKQTLSYGLLLKKGLPREVEAHSLTRPGNREASHLLNQQLQTTCEDNNRSLPMSMAG